MTSTTAVAADPVKAKHRLMWALGDYHRVATELIPALGSHVVEASQVRPGERVLDVAAGSGNATIPAARQGATVVGTDLTPELLEHGRQDADRQGLSGIEWREADAEALPFGDGEFDVVVSTVGVMFAPRHQAVADELVRVCRPGGRIGLANWTPQGFIGQMFATMKPYAAPPPPGSQPPPLWGDEAHVAGLFGPRVSDLEMTRHTLAVDHFPTPGSFVEYFKAHYGPTIAIYRGIAGEPDRVAALDESLTDLAARFGAGTEGGMGWEYLLVTATRT